MAANKTFDLHLDGQTVGHFAAASGLEIESDEVHLPGLRRAYTVELTDGHLTAEYEEWLAYGRSQVGHHGELIGPDHTGAPTRWVFEEGWPTGSVPARTSPEGRIGLRMLVMEIEHVTHEPAPPPEPSPPAVTPPPAPVPAAAPQPVAEAPAGEVPAVEAPQPLAERRVGFWWRLFRRSR